MANRHEIRRWKNEDKLKLLTEACSLSDQELGLFLRKNGLHSSDLQIWRQEILESLDNTRPVHPECRRELKNRIKNLEKELKEKNALLEAQKKIQNLLEEEEVKPPLKPEKKSSKS